MTRGLFAGAGKLLGFVREGIWRIRARNLPGKRALPIRLARILLLAARQFERDRCKLRASALTYYSLLSVVPVLAMAFGIAKGFGMDKSLERQILERFQEQQDVAVQLITYANAFLEDTKGGLIAGVGVALLFWTIVKVLGHIERSFNDIWRVTQGRSLVRKFTDYLSLMLIAPLLFVMAGSATVLVTGHVAAVTERVAILGALGPAIFLLLEAVPYLIIWLLFTLLYVMMPHTRVKFTAGLFGGIVAGTMYQFVQWAYITFQIGVASYGAVYGSFAALPLLLVWLQLSWMVLLFGAELAYAAQNEETYEFEQDSLEASRALRRLLALRVAHLCVKNFEVSGTAWTEEQIAERMEIPLGLARQIVRELSDARVLAAVKIDEGEDAFGYQPARHIDALSVLEVVALLDRRGLARLPVGNSPELERLSRRLELFREAIQASGHDVPLKDV